MKINNLNLQELRKLIFEDFDYMSELEVVDNTPGDTNQRISPSSVTQHQLDKLSPGQQHKALDILKKIQNNQRFEFTFKTDKINRYLSHYILNTVIALYNENKERKYKDAAWLILAPENINGQKTDIFKEFFNKYRNSTMNYQAQEDMITDAMINTFIKLIDSIEINIDSGNFEDLFFLSTKNTLIDIWRKEYKRQEKGEDITNFNISLDDDPYGDSESKDNESGITRADLLGKEDDISNEKKDKILRLTDKFVTKVLENNKNPLFLNIYIGYVHEGKSDENIAKDFNITPAAVRVYKQRAEEYVTRFFINGKYQKYMEINGVLDIEIPPNFKFFFMATKQEYTKKAEKQLAEQIAKYIPGKNKLVINYFISEEDYLLETALDIKKKLKRMGDVYKKLDYELTLRETQLNEDNSQIGLLDIDKTVKEFAEMCINAIESMKEPLTKLEYLALNLEDEQSVPFKTISNIVGNTVLSLEEELFGQNIYGHVNQKPGYLKLLQAMIDKVNAIVHRGYNTADYNNKLLDAQKAKNPNVNKDVGLN